jgi:hypothetical protein
MSLVQRLYDRVLRPRLPRKIGVYGGIPCRAPKLLDQQTVVPDHEIEARQALMTSCRPGDRVLILGGGFGATAVTAARAVGPGGEVLVYEAARSRVNALRETMRINDVSEQTSILAGAVGPQVDVWGESAAASIHPSSLPPADVIEMDIEGAEYQVLPELEQIPRTLIVELHPDKVEQAGEPTEPLTEIPAADSYEISYHDSDDDGTVTAVAQLIEPDEPDDPRGEAPASDQTQQIHND